MENNISSTQSVPLETSFQANPRWGRPKWQTDGSESTQLMESHKGAHQHLVGVIAKVTFIIFRQGRSRSNFEPFLQQSQESFLEKKGCSSYFH